MTPGFLSTENRAWNSPWPNYAVIEHSFEKLGCSIRLFFFNSKRGFSGHGEMTLLLLWKSLKDVERGIAVSKKVENNCSRWKLNREKLDSSLLCSDNVFQVQSFSPRACWYSVGKGICLMLIAAKKEAMKQKYFGSTILKGLKNQTHSLSI